MLENTGILVAGLSGGADSVCLVAVLKEIIEKEQLDIRLLAVHVNHGIRGTEAERDEQFAKQVCRQLSVEYISRRVDVPSVAHQEKLSEEEAGRILRYRIFKEIATQQEKHTGRKVKIAVTALGFRFFSRYGISSRRILFLVYTSSSLVLSVT